MILLEEVEIHRMGHNMILLEVRSGDTPNGTSYNCY